jgi:hypothetical protein
LAFIRGYQITGNTAFRSQAAYAFNRIYDNGWSSDFGGGIWWDFAHTNKSGLSNNPTVILGSYLYSATGDVNYLNKSKAIYAWVKSRLYNSSTGATYENTGSTDVNVYNAGAFISAANCLRNITGTASYADDAKRTIDYVRNNKTSGGILTSGQRGGTWQSEFIRGIGDYIRDRGDNSYDAWLTQNANACWNSRRTDRNITWNNWTSATPTDNSLGANECIGGVIMMQTAGPGGGGGGGVTIPNGTYRLINRGSGKALDCRNGGTANLVPIVQNSYTGANSQRWTLTSLGNSEYRLINVASGRSIDVSGGSTADNAALILWDYTGGTNQRFRLTSPASGYYVITFVHSGKAIDVPGGSTANDIALIQWGVNNGNNQQWQFLAP